MLCSSLVFQHWLDGGHLLAFAMPLYFNDIQLSSFIQIKTIDNNNDHRIPTAETYTYFVCIRQSNAVSLFHYNFSRAPLGHSVIPVHLIFASSTNIITGENHCESHIFVHSFRLFGLFVCFCFFFVCNMLLPPFTVAIASAARQQHPHCYLIPLE